jgi:hypothetical protein
MAFHFGGYFDDSVAFDLNGDGTIDYALSYDDLSATRPSYAPWSSLQDAGNLGVVLDITSTGTTATSYLYGSVVHLNSSASVNNLSGFTLSPWA